MKNHKQQLAVLREIAQDHGRFREEYSGRGMFGKTCVGIDTDEDPIGVIEKAAELGIKGARWDNMGRGFIVYWPGIGGVA